MLRRHGTGNRVYLVAVQHVVLGMAPPVQRQQRAAGEVERVTLQESAGNEALDEAALAVGRVMRFAPATNRGEVVTVWVSIPITFQVR